MFWGRGAAMPEKQVNLELVSSYTLEYDSEPTEVTERDTVPARFVKRRDWGVDVGRDWFQNTDLFPYLEDLDSENREITFEVYTIDDQGIRNGKAQCVVWTEFGGSTVPYVKWDAMYKNGQMHGACRTYDVKLVSKLTDKTFYVDGKAVDAKTVAQWRKMQSAMNTKTKSKQIKGR